MIIDQDRIDADIKLAELLGWYFGAAADDPTEDWRDASGRYSAYPRWTRDWAACGPLIAEHALIIEPAGFGIAVKRQTGAKAFRSYPQEFVEHATPDAAIRYAIVQTVIEKIEKEKEPI